MSRRLALYLVIVGVVAAAVMGFSLPRDLDSRWIHYVTWAVIAVLSEMMWIQTTSGVGTWSLSSTAILASVILWGVAPAIWIAAVSTLVADLLVLRKSWIKAAFNAAQIAITMALAGGAFHLLGGPLHGLGPSPPLGGGSQTAVQLVPPILALFAVFLIVNRSLVAVAVAWSTDRPWVKVLREDWFYFERLTADVAAFLLSPLMVISFEAIGYLGVALFYAPLFMIFESGRRYEALRRAQNQIIHSERMAAKGEMAAELGHELRNQLVAISGRAQMLIRDAERSTFDSVARHAQIILDQSRRMEAMSKGLMDFSRAELQIERLDLNALIQRSVEFVRSQNRFDGVEWDLRLADPVPMLRGDPGQLQQVLLNLFLNAADAMAGQSRRAIGVTTAGDDRGRVVRIVVTDTGTGIAAANLSRIFEPQFTTKPEGHGFGLSTSYRIITNHGGTIAATSPPGQGACFTVTLPVHGPGGWG